MSGKSSSDLSLKTYLVIGLILISIVAVGNITWVNIGKTSEVVKISSTLVKNTKEGSDYIVQIQKSMSDTNIEPIKVENNLFGLGRLDKTTMFGQFEVLAQGKKCARIELHGTRIPSISMRGVTDFKEVTCPF